MDKPKTNTVISEKVYKLLYVILGHLSEAERRSVFEHVLSPEFDEWVKESMSINKRRNILKISLLWDIMRRYTPPQLQYISLEKIDFK